MKAMLRLALVLTLAGAHLVAAEDVGANVTPIQKVLELLQGMVAKGKEEKHAEQVQYAAYKQFCDDTSAQKTAAIGEADEAIEVLKADIQKHAADIELLTKEIAAHQEDISVWTGDGKAATKVREIEKAGYDSLHKDYSESVEALQMAIAVLKKQAYDRKQTSLVQVSDRLKNQFLIPEEAKRAIDAFLEQDPDPLDVTAPEANAYEFQSTSIIEMLEKLLDKFVDERTTLEKEEMTSIQAFEVLMQDLKNQIAGAEEDVSKKTSTKAKRIEAKASAEADLADTIATRDADQKYLDDLTAVCEQKAADFESRQQLRAEELEALAEAIEIISSSAVAGAGEKHLPALVQAGKQSLSQLRADGRSPAQERAERYLQDQAKKINSRVLSMIAERVSFEPFKKVKKMIKDLIYRLMEEAGEEATHKGWCDTELATNEQSRKEKTLAIETLNAEIDSLVAEIALLTGETEELAKAVAELDAAMAKATQLRGEEKAKNAETIKDAQDAQTAVAQAITVLKEFYAKAADATALVQQKKKQTPPPIFEGPYKGMQGMKGGVVSMLEVIESDFARVESETAAAEATAEKEYQKFMSDSEIDKSSKTTDIANKKVKVQEDEQALERKKVDLEGTQKELDAALAYFDKLKPSCVDAAISYDARVAQRKEEIASLQEALKILSGMDIA